MTKWTSWKYLNAVGTTFSSTSTTNTSVYIVVCMAIDRFISVYLPYAAKFISTPRRAVFVCIIIVLSQFSINLHFVWTYRLLPKSNATNDECLYPEKYEQWIKYIWTWIDLSIYSFIPVTTLVSLSSPIIYKVIKQKKQVTTIATSSNSSSYRSITIILIVICVVMLLCNTPIVVLNLVTPWLDLSTRRREAGYELALAIAEHLMFLNNSINFFLYIVTTKRFREEVFIKLRLHNVVFPVGSA